MEPVKLTVANNLVELRKGRKLTQQQLADKFNYSDKSVSKWEHGETLPDIETLKLLCDFYGVTLDYLVTPPDQQEKKKEFVKDEPKRAADKNTITGLAVSVVWMVASLLYFGIYVGTKAFPAVYPEPIHFWMAFVWAVPVSLLMFIIFNGIWGKKRWSTGFIIAFIWTLLAAGYLQLGSGLDNYFGWNLWMIFLIGVPLTIATALFGKLKGKK